MVCPGQMGRIWGGILRKTIMCRRLTGPPRTIGQAVYPTAIWPLTYYLVVSDIDGAWSYPQMQQKTGVKTPLNGHPGRGVEAPTGGCIEGVWSSGPTGLPPYVARARAARPKPGGQRGARAWPEKPKGNERKRKRKRKKVGGCFFEGRSGISTWLFFLFFDLPRVQGPQPPARRYK